MTKRILVVEDQPDNRQIIRDMLAGNAPNQGQSRDAIDSDHCRHLPRAGWGRTDSASGRM
jgi:CheY-like chemotaxis protein